MMMSGDNLREFPVIQGNTIHDPDNLGKVKHVIQEQRTRARKSFPRSTTTIRTHRNGIPEWAMCSTIPIRRMHSCKR